MARWYSNGPGIRSGRWKLLVGSVLGAGLIGLFCGLCESSTKAVCMNMLTAIASSLSLTDQKTNAPKTNSIKGTTCPMTTRSIITTLEISSKDCGSTSPKKFATFTVANTGRKISGLTITHASSIAHLTINTSINKSKE